MDNQFDLVEEFVNMPPDLSAWAVERVMNAGVSFRALNACGYVAGCRARIEGNHFIPDPHGVRMIVQPVYDGAIPSITEDVILEEDEIFLADLIAWAPEQPGKWYFRRFEHGLILGKQNLTFERFKFLTRDAVPLTIFSSPLEWLRGGGKGVCPLTRSGMRALLGLPRVFCPDKIYATRLAEELRKPCPTIPKIITPQESRSHVVA